MLKCRAAHILMCCALQTWCIVSLCIYCTYFKLYCIAIDKVKYNCLLQIILLNLKTKFVNIKIGCGLTDFFDGVLDWF